MTDEIETLRSKFLKLYASVPTKLRNEIIAIIDNHTYSWDSAFIEIDGKNEIGDKMLKKLEDIGLFKGD